MDYKKVLSLGVAILAGVAMGLAAAKPAETEQRDAPKALEQLLQLAGKAQGEQSLALAESSKPMRRESSRNTEEASSTQMGRTNSQTNSRAPALQRRYPRYRVENGDVLSIRFAIVPDLNQTVTVQPDGYISLREVADMHVEGLTTPQITDKIREAYSKILQDPTVTIILQEFDKPYFVVGGQVARPGKFELRGDTTVTEAIEIAGGFTEKSKHSQVLLFRRVSNKWMEVTPLNVKEMLHSGNLSEDPHLHAGDMLFVPQNTLSKVRQFLPIPHSGVVINPSAY